MKLFNVAVVGATGLVGRKIVMVLEERNFPINKLTLLASEKSAGKEMDFKGHSIRIETIKPEAFRTVDIAIFSAGASVSKEFAPEAVKRNTIVIDNSSAFRMERKVPLVVPEVNRRAVFRHNGIIANPNCSTIQLVLVLKPLHDYYTVRRVVVSTYQAVAGAGQKGIDQLEAEINKQLPTKRAFSHRIAFNCLPHIDSFMEDGSTKEEWKMVVETKKIMNDDNIEVSATCVRVPVYHGHSEAVNIELKKKYDVSDIRQLLEQSEGVTVIDDTAANQYPMPISAEDRNDVFVGRIRRDLSIKNGLNLWIVSDNLRKGAATNAVQIAEVLAVGK